MSSLAPRLPLHWFRLPRLRLTWSHLWRCSLIALMLLTYVADMWAGIVSPAVAYAAVRSQQRTLLVPASTKPARRGTYASNISPCPALTGTPEIEGSLDGLGTLSTYTFVKHPADDRLLMETNVINGNLVAQYNALQIQGTGLNLDITLTYNAQASISGILGANWNLSVGNGVALSFNGANATFSGPSGYNLPFEADSNSYGGFAEPPGIDATLLNSSVNGASHVLIFQHTSECLGFNSSGQEIFDQDKNGHQITFAYNGSGNLASITDTQNRLTSFGYDGSGRIKLITDPINRTVQLGYDSNNNLTSIIDLNGKTTTLGYTAAPHDLTSIATPVSGHTTAIHYQSSGNRVNQITDALSNNTYVAYYSPGDSQCGAITTLACSTFKDANNHTTIYGSDDLQVKAVLDGNGNMASTSYTPDANINQYTDPLSHVTTFGYQTGTNNLSSVTDGNKAGSSYDYDDPNHPYLPTKVIDAQGNSLSYVYDSNGNLKSATDSTPGGTGSSATYTYNTTGVAYGSYLYGLLLKVQDGDGNLTQYTYNTYGNLHYVTPPSPLGQQTIVVDAVSRLSSVTDGRGNTVNITPDPLDRITSLAYPNGTVSYLYNDDGDEKSVTDGTGTTNFLYDGDNRLKVKTLPNSATLSVSYDPVGNVQTYVDSGGTVTYFYDSANRLKQVQEPDGSTTNYGYNNANELTSISYPAPNNTGEVFGYDGAGHVTSAVAGIMSGGKITTTYASFSYSYLKGTTPTQLIQTDTLLDPVNQSATYTRHYTYDTMNRLQEAEVDQNGSKVQDWSYVYDKAGNRTQSTVLSTGATTSYSYNAAEELTKTMQGSTTVNYSYDGNGNLTSSSDGNSFSYTKKNQTSAINSNSYTYSGPDQTERVQLNGTTDAYSGLGLSYETTSGSTTYYTRCSCGRLLNERLPSGSKYYYLFDGQGSVVGLTDSTGKEVNAYDYDPYGVILNEATGQPNPFQYEGGYFESSTGLVKFGTRYYNPNLGRWTQQDPKVGNLTSPDTLNRYLYTQDDPVNMVDPSGRSSCLVTIIGELAGFAGTAFDGFLAGLGLLDVAAGVVALSAATLISWILFPILGVIAAYFLAEAISICTGGSEAAFPL